MALRHRWRYKPTSPPRKLPRPSRPVVVATLAVLVGAAFWIAGFRWGVVLVVLGVAGLFIAGIWGIRQTSGTNPDDPAFGVYSQNLLEVHFPDDAPVP
jgi:hypothetical protein